MDVVVLGGAGPGESAGRSPAVLLDGVLRLDPTGALAGPGRTGPPDGYRVRGTAAGAGASGQAAALTEVTGPDRDRLLWLPLADRIVGSPSLAEQVASLVADGSGPVGHALVGAGSATAAGHALARLRAAGLVTDRTVCALVGDGEDWPAPAEVALRAGHWGALLPGDDGRLPAGPPAGSGSGPDRRLPRRTLVLGGSRSGKSALAEDLLAAEPAVLYLATGDPPDPTADAEWARRVAEHRSRRPGWWQTAETADAAAVLAGGTVPVLLDSVGSWLAAALDAAGAWQQATGWRERFTAERDRLVSAWRGVPVPVVAVAEEVGSGLVAGTPGGRLFADELGRLNQLLAARSEQVLLCVAGRTLVVARDPAAGTASSAGTEPGAPGTGPRAGAR